MMVKSGMQTSFWHDNWVGKPLVPLLKGAHNPPRQKINLRKGLTLLQTLLPRPWDHTTQLLLENRIHLSRDDEKDTLLWCWTSDGSFSVSSIYNVISTGGKLNNNLSVLWKFKVPPSLKFFMFLVFNDKLLTQQQLLRRHLLSLQPRCILCNQNVLEDNHHLFFSCPFTSMLWLRLRTLLALPALLQTHSIQDSILLTLQQKWNDEPFRTHLTTFFWAAWTERNNQIFRGCNKDMESMCSWIINEAKLFLKYC
ncbi:RNA-directed DNA polymerase (reverse transcriptase)-related family protein [Rhynchospora pubera]|uniref:RNA-directed DNA polymerase (Reverse transcriptase)-related family protein n=1 Tax=Rhynchospora pubera TaxID=906938 RepID=A0AAV8ETM8_9POAL|nr:RNA-directed DNA polymerase (reverse transcriptase)-related family protein [Rhynchospora pubera]